MKLFLSESCMSIPAPRDGYASPLTSRLVSYSATGRRTRTRSPPATGPAMEFFLGLFSSSRPHRSFLTRTARIFVQLVVCDGAPDVTGLHPFDEYIQHQLLLSAINITTRVLRPGGTFVAKVFRGRDVGLVYAQLRLLFEDVSCAKPAACRNASLESFVVCRGFGGGALDVARCLDLELEGGWDEGCGGVGGLREHPGEDIIVPAIVPFVACPGRHGGRGRSGEVDVDFMDSDKSYAVTEARAPLAPPIQPPYEVGKAKAKEAKACCGLRK